MTPPSAFVPDGPAAAASSATTTLDQLGQGYCATISELAAADNQVMGDHLERLMELGFLPGETVRIVAKGFPSGDPVAVRIGQATFALRRFEAEWIRVRSVRKAETP